MTSERRRGRRAGRLQCRLQCRLRPVAPVAARARSTGLLLGLLLLLGALPGCGGAPGVHQRPQTAYPPEQYLVAVGTSDRSQAEAEARARAAVAAQVRSSLTSRTTTQSQSVWSDDQERLSAEAVQRLDQQAAFSRAELIRIDQDSRRQQDGTWYAVAYLPRREASEALRRDYEAAASELARRADAVQAVPPGDLPGFAAAYGEAQESWLALERSARELRAVTGGWPASLARDQAAWDAVQARRQALFADIRVALRLQEPRPAGDLLDREYLRHALIAALTDLGVSVRGDGCEDDVAYVLDLQPRLRYQGVVGVVCRLELAGALRECATGDGWDLHLSDPVWTGEGANTYAARTQAAAAVTAATLRPRLVAALAASLPVR